jgi:AcrR family transcriptional regulator
MARADAAPNREKILAAAREAFAEPGTDPSMAEVSRRAGVGMATLYRNFPGRRELLEALYEDEVDAMCAAAAPDFEAWVRRFLRFSSGKRQIAVELLAHDDEQNPIFNASRDRVLASGRPLLAAAQASGEIRADVSLEQILDMVMAIAGLRGDAEPMLRVVFDGLKA